MKGEDLDASILSIAGPALLALAADPLANLVDTAWVGHLGAVPLAAVGVAVTVQNLFTKVVNVPLLSVTTSAVASTGGETAEISKVTNATVRVGLAVGTAQAALLLAGGAQAVQLLGVDGADAGLLGASLGYLRIRALGAPAAVLILTILGSFRGLGDTRTPLVATVLGNVVNVGLDPVLIYGLGMGVNGAAWATVFAEYLTVYVLAAKLKEQHGIGLGGDAERVGSLSLVGRTGLLALRSMGVVGVFTLATSLATRSGATYAAAHQVAVQLWLSTSLLADALAVAAQSLLGQKLAAGERRGAKALLGRVAVYATGMGALLALGLGGGRSFLPGLFTEDPEVLGVIATIMPWVILTQPVTSCAFVGDGVLFGASDFNFATVTMLTAAGLAAATMLVGFDAADGARMQLVWLGLAVLMAVRAGMVLFRYFQVGGKGPFEDIRTSEA